MSASLTGVESAGTSRATGRTEPRFEVSERATVQVLGDMEPVIPARIVDISGNGMCVETGRALPVRQTVKIEAGDTLWLAEICYSQECPRGRGQFRTGLRIEHALYHTADLKRRAEVFLD